MTTSSKQVAAIHAKIDRGEHITRDERAEILSEECARLRKEILGALQDERDQHDNVVQYTQGTHNALGKAVTLLLIEMMTLSAAHSERRQDLEQALRSLVESETRCLLAFIEGQAKTLDRLSRTVDALLSASGKTASTQGRRRA